MLVHELGGPAWSFTVHGPEEFDKPRFIGLGEKIRACSFVVAVSSYTRSQLFRWSAMQDWPKVQIVHCGLEPAYFGGPAIGVPATRRLICVGRLCEQKGQLLLVEAVRRLTIQGLDFELVLAGDGEMRGAIEALIMRHSLEGRVRITGWISGGQVRDEILAASGACAAELCRGPSRGHHGGNGVEAAGHMHIRGRNSRVGADRGEWMARAVRRRGRADERHAGMSVYTD